MDVALSLRAFFNLSAILILAVSAVKPIRQRFVTYGSRASAVLGSNPLAVPATKQAAELPKTWTTSLMDAVSKVQVPHSWFIHFYIVSVTSSLFWAAQIVFKGRAIQAVCLHDTRNVADSMTLDQVLLTWALMLAQGSRRLYECLEFTKPSSSKMWIAHWAIGITFYLAMSLAVWVEGIPTIQISELSVRSFLVKAPSFRTIVAVPLFLLASKLQYDCHQHLASLKKYSLPTHPLFQAIICPHYFAECLIYISLTIVAAPPGQYLNKTIYCAFVFVAVNLGITAGSTREWYVKKFGEDSIKGRWNMVPYVY